jgi:flagellar biosynthesis protein FliP
MKKTVAALLLVVFFVLLFPAGLLAQSRTTTASGGVTTSALPVPFLGLSVGTAQGNNQVSLSVQLLLLLTVLTISPSILILTTAFLRIAIVFDFIRRALSLNSSPPNQVMMGLALFLTVFIMWPTLTDIYNNSLKPFSDGKIGLSDMYTNAEKPLRTFMFSQMANDTDSISLFMTMRGLPKPVTRADVPTFVLVPAFVIHELTQAFKIGILLFIPFIIIDMVVSSTLMSMGMIMLPPVMISTPFKLILFVLVNGWGLLTEQLVRSFLK